tara:strand:- start:264 stop:527 length:264 start_codon:yes stop_codon:yes gene_type:complete
LQKINKLIEKNPFFKACPKRASPANARFEKTSILAVKADEFGYHAVKDYCAIHDLISPLLPIMGIYIKRLAYRQLGRDFRLIDEFVI